MILVPRSRYELLIELYAANMADINVRNLQRQLESKLNEKASVNVE